MAVETLLLFFSLALIAEILGTVGGFGSSVFFVPVSAIFFDFQTVLGITAVFHLASNISKIGLFWRGIDLRVSLLIGIPAVLFVIAGGYLSAFADGKVLELFLSFFLISLSLLFLLVKQLVLKPNATNAIAGGALSGFMAGLLGTGGAIRGLTMAAFNMEKTMFIATSAVIDMGIDATRTVVYYQNGFIHRHDLYLIPGLILVGFTGSYAGKKLLSYIPQQQFRRIALVLILLVGIVTLLKSLQIVSIVLE